MDPSANIITITNDSLGRKLSMSDPVMGTWKDQYDLLGRMTNQLDVKGNRVTFDYSDGWGRLKTKRVYGPTNNLVDTVTYFYDSSDSGSFTVYTGQLYKVIQSLATSRHSYDTHGNILKSEINVTNFGVYVSTNTYDELDRPLTATYPNSVAKLTNRFDVVGGIKSLGSSYGVGTNNVTFFEVNSNNVFGQVLKVTYGNHVQSTFQYYPLLPHRLMDSVSEKDGESSYQHLVYKYNAKRDD